MWYTGGLLDLDDTLESYPVRGASERVFRRRRRHVFRKRSLGERVFGPAIGLLAVVAGLVLFVPWLTLSSADNDVPKVEDSQDQAEQAAAEDHPEQETETDRSEDEKAREDLPSEEVGALDDPLPPSPSRSSPSSPVQAPSLPSTPPPSPPGVQDPGVFSTPNGYWDYDNWVYYEPAYWEYYVPGY
jgi:hypothetical protein